jgi:hypothetical protein
LNAALRAQENSLAAKREDDEHDREMEAWIEERRQKAILEIARMEREAPGFAPKDNTRKKEHRKRRPPRSRPEGWAAGRAPNAKSST